MIATAKNLVGRRSACAQPIAWVGCETPLSTSWLRVAVLTLIVTALPVSNACWLQVSSTPHYRVGRCTVINMRMKRDWDRILGHRSLRY